MRNQVTEPTVAYLSLTCLVRTPQLLGRVFCPSDIWKKTIPTTFITFSIWYGYLCPPHKILGGLYESSKDPYEKRGL